MVTIGTLNGGNITITTGGSAPAGHADTWVKYTGDTEWTPVSIKGSLEGFYDEGEDINCPTNQILNVTNVVAIEIGTDVTSIGDYAFNNCYELTNVMIPDGVTSIGDSAFYGCSGLTSMTMPNVTSISDSAFYCCSGLTSVTMPNVTSIGESAFRSSGLTSVTIPESVESIDMDAFYGCESTTDVYCYPNPANLLWGEGDCDDFKSNGSTICHVKSEYLSAYQTKFSGIVNVTFVGDLA